jgi:hypothetical protein
VDKNCLKIMAIASKKFSLLKIHGSRKNATDLSHTCLRPSVFAIERSLQFFYSIRQNMVVALVTIIEFSLSYCKHKTHEELVGFGSAFWYCGKIHARL